MQIEGRTSKIATIASGESVSGNIDLMYSALLGIIMPSAWTTAALTVEVSADGGTTWTGLAYDQDGVQCNAIASPVALRAYAVNIAGLLPYRMARLRSGSTASPVNQSSARNITLITRPLA